MNDVIKAKRNSLTGKYYDYLFEVTKYLQSQNLTKYAFYKLRDRAIEDIYKAQEEGIPVEKVYKKGHEHFFEKKCEKLPKMGILEQISNVVMVFFVLFSVMAIFVYIYRFFVSADTFYSHGVYLHISVDNLRNMIIYGFLGAVVSVFLQKIEKKRKYIQAASISGIGIVCVVTTILMENVIQGNIKLNMVIVIPVFLTLSVLGYVSNDLLSKKKYQKSEIIIEEEKK